MLITNFDYFFDLSSWFMVELLWPVCLPVGIDLGAGCKILYMLELFLPSFDLLFIVWWCSRTGYLSCVLLKIGVLLLFASSVVAFRPWTDCLRRLTELLFICPLLFWSTMLEVKFSLTCCYFRWSRLLDANDLRLFKNCIFAKLKGRR